MMIEICTSHFKEDLAWLKKSPWLVNVVHHEGGEPVTDFESITTIPNVGNEATSYLKFIIDRYDTLPDFTAFLHGHEESHHQYAGRPILDLIRDANTDKYNYIPLNNMWRFIESKNNLVTPFRKFLVRTELLYRLPMFYVTCIGAQFIVSKECIQANPKAFYEKLFSYVESTEDAIALEYMWCIIFGKITETPSIDYFNPPLKNICYFSHLPFPFEHGPIIRFMNCKQQHIRDEFPEIRNITSLEEYVKQYHDGACIIYFSEDGSVENGIIPTFKLKSDCVKEDVTKIVKFIEKMNCSSIEELDLLKTNKNNLFKYN